MSTNLRDVNAYQASFWLWDNVNAVFQKYDRTKYIRVSDVDTSPQSTGMIELEGQFLFLEGKPRGHRWEKGDFNGQLRLLKALARKPDNSVIVFEGDAPHVPDVVCEYVERWIIDVLHPPRFVEL